MHLAGHGVLEQRGIVLQCGGQERLARDEQHDELRRGADRGPVRLRREPVHVLAQMPGVGV